MPRETAAVSAHVLWTPYNSASGSSSSSSEDELADVSNSGGGSGSISSSSSVVAVSTAAKQEYREKLRRLLNCSSRSCSSSRRNVNSYC